MGGRAMGLRLALAACFAGRNRQPADQGQRHNSSEKESHTPPVRNRRRKSHLNLLFFLGLLSCAGNHRPLLEDLNHGGDMGLMRLGGARGVRDGDRLSVQLLITDSSSILTMDLHFQVTPPTRLESGTWNLNRGGTGKVGARSVTFLGGQNGPPSLGGTFDLFDAQGQARYRVHLPTTELKR